MEEQLEEGQIVLCTVDKIIGTTVFVKIQDDGERLNLEKDNGESNKIQSGIEGTLITSEISPGRIRNLRDYVVPGKKIVCKILRIIGNRIHLSLRRVKQHEKKELLDKIKKEKNLKAILKTVLKDKSKQIIEKIMLEYSLTDFFEKIKENSKPLEKYTTKQESEKIMQIIKSKKEKPKEIKQVMRLSSKAPEGILKIKEIINKACKDSKCEVSYIAAGKYNLKIKGEDFKKIKTEINKVLDSIEKQAKSQKCDFEVEKTKH